MTVELYLSHILRVTQGVLVAPVAQEGRQVLICRSLGYPVNLAPQGGLVDRAPTLLWVPEMCQEEVIDRFRTFFATKMTQCVTMET